MKKYFVLFVIALLLLTSCSNQRQDDTVQTEEEAAETEVSILPSHSLGDDQYKTLLPYKPSAARGAITNQITNRVDIDELEEGLRRHSTEYFDPEKYVYEEGQYLTTEHIYDLIDSLNPKLSKKGSKDEQIKEHRDNPRVFSHILEQNYLIQKDNKSVELAGVSIGIALKSVYRFQTEVGGPYYYENISKSEMLEEGKKIAERVLSELREITQLQNVPIMIALFREEEQSSPVAGNFVAKTFVEKGENSIGEWENINEENVLFPSEKAKEDYYEDYQKIDSFAEKIASYFPNYVGIAGEGFYIDGNLTRLSIEIPIEFYGKGEVIGFTQYTYGLVKEIFPNYFDIEIIVTSIDGTESVIYRKAGEEDPEVHIFH